MIYADDLSGAQEMKTIDHKIRQMSMWAAAIEEKSFDVHRGPPILQIFTASIIRHRSKRMSGGIVFNSSKTCPKEFSKGCGPYLLD